MRINMNSTIRAFGGVLIFALIILGIHVQKASATFIIDTDPGGVKFFNSDDNKDVSSFSGYVGGVNFGMDVNVATIANVDSGAGYATITPVKGVVLTDLIFTPQDPNLFSDFSFRGQLVKFGKGVTKGTITVKVFDNQGHGEQVFTFDIDKANADFERIGIVSEDEETIKSVEIFYDGGFKEVKQINFSGAGVTEPIPEPGMMLLVGSGLAGLIGYGRRRFNK